MESQDLIPDLIQLLENRREHNERLRVDAMARGDVVEVANLDKDSAKATVALNRLRSLPPQ